VRISSHPFALALVEAFGGPIATTSANRHGMPSPYSPEEILQQWKGTASEVLLVDHGRLAVAPPSTVVQVVGSGLTVLRQGALHVS
jgi:L-threonylcarbamoyladenylate synthase